MLPWFVSYNVTTLIARPFTSFALLALDAVGLSELEGAVANEAGGSGSRHRAVSAGAVQVLAVKLVEAVRIQRSG